MDPSFTGCASGNNVTPGKKSIVIHSPTLSSVNVCDVAIAEASRLPLFRP
jgi:hypothetical protein